MKTGPFFSIIIPTVNEEFYLPKLLRSLKEQTFRDFEVIVADGGSSDRTTRIAREADARVISCEQRGISYGRNAGASVARGRLFVFLDADVIAPKNYMEEIWRRHRARPFDVGMSNIAPISSRAYERFVHWACNALMALFFPIFPHISGFCTICSSSLFKKIGGFDETLKHGEDVDFGRRAARIGRLAFIEDLYIWVSTRRMEKEGRLRLPLMYARDTILLQIFGRRYRKEIYEFGRHDTDIGPLMEKELAGLQKLR